MQQNIYDNNEFFENYKNTRLSNDSFNELLEQPAMKRLLPDLQGKTVLDLGCGFGFNCKDKKAQTDETKPKIKEFYLHDQSQIVQVFVNAFDNICRIEKDSKNALFPILNYDDNHHSLEISFLEHYKTLEYIKTEENKAKGKGKCTTFLLNILKDNQSLKNRFFGNQPEQEIEQEIRNLRNYYSHTGFYIDDKLPIEKNYKVIRYKDIDNKWLFNVFEFVKIATYIGIYKKCGIDIKWNEIINYLDI